MQMIGRKDTCLCNVEMMLNLSDLVNMNSKLFDLIYENLDLIKLYVDFTDYFEIKLNSRSRESRFLYQLFDKLEKVYTKYELVELVELVEGE